MSSRSFPLDRKTRQIRWLMWPRVPVKLPGCPLDVLSLLDPHPLKVLVPRAKVNYHLVILEGWKTVHRHIPVNLLRSLQITIAPHPPWMLLYRLASPSPQPLKKKPSMDGTLYSKRPILAEDQPQVDCKSGLKARASPWVWRSSLRDSGIISPVWYARSPFFDRRLIESRLFETPN
jgi:hypothetical protein